MINSIKSNTISEADATKKLNELNEVKKVEIKGKRLTDSQKKITKLFDNLLKTIFNKTVNESNSSTKNESNSDNESNSSTKNKSNNDNKSNSSTTNESNSDNESNSNTKNESKSDYESDNESDNEGEKDKYYYEIRQLINWFETIDQTKSLEEQMELLKEKGEFLSEYWYVRYYNDNKELNYKIFKAKAAYLLIDLNKKIFEKTYACKFATLVEKLINTVDKKEENQIIIDDIENNRSKISKEYKFDKDVIKHSGDLDDAVKIILEINKVLTSNKVNNDNNLIKLYKNIL